MVSSSASACSSEPLAATASRLVAELGHMDGSEGQTAALELMGGALDRVCVVGLDGDPHLCQTLGRLGGEQLYQRLWFMTVCDESPDRLAQTRR
jgi:hypothetical protein